MKKLVPDPPSLIINTPYFSFHSGLIPTDALAHASELLRGATETLEEHCRLYTREPGMHMLGNAAHASNMARALIEHALKRLDVMQGVAP